MNDIKSISLMKASEINGTSVENVEGEDIGKIQELVIDMDFGRVSYAVLQFGGIMGLGDKLFAIPWEAFSKDVDKDGFILNIDKDVLKNAEGFDKDNWPQMANYDFLGETYDYFGYQQYW